MNQRDRRLCRWYGHRPYEHESTAFEPPQFTVRCLRCSKTLAGPYMKWEGRMIPMAEMVLRNIYKETPLLSHFLNKP